MKTMYVAKSQSQTTAATTTFIKQIDSWIMELRSKNLCQSMVLLKPRSRKASKLMIKHRAANITYRDALERFKREPRMENLPPVHAVLKKLCIPKHNTTLDYIILSE